MKNKESYYKRTKSFWKILYLILKGLNWKNRWRKFREMKHHVFETRHWVYTYIDWYYRGISDLVLPTYNGKWSELWINRIKVRIRWKYIYVDIYSSRPGMIIGRQGKDFYTLQDYLNDNRFSKEVKINVIDFDPFEF